MVNRHLLYLLAVAFLFSCKPTVPSEFIQPDEMENILYDYHIAQAMATDGVDDMHQRGFNQELYFAAVLEKYGVTREKFDSSLVYYYKRADRFRDIYSNITERLSKEALTLGVTEGEVNRFVSFTASEDTCDIWAGERSAMLLPYFPYNRLDFIQKPDSSFRKGDAFSFVINNSFIYQSGSRSAEACLIIKYDNDTVVSRAISVSSSGINQLYIPANEDHAVKEIRGYIYLQPERESSTTLKLMGIQSIQLFKFRRKKPEKNSSQDLQKKDSLNINNVQNLQ